jgi:catechol 2,3-dioxygenase-like lactoylglutathione lyase family enzyme
MKTQILFKKLDHIQLCIPVGMEQEGRAFYCGILGLAEVEKPEPLKKNGGFWLQMADVQLHIGVEAMEGKSKRHPAFEIEKIAEAKAYLVSKGVRVKDDAAIPGVTRFSIFDPWDNRIELLEKHG